MNMNNEATMRGIGIGHIYCDKDRNLVKLADSQVSFVIIYYFVHFFLRAVICMN